MRDAKDLLNISTLPIAFQGQTEGSVSLALFFFSVKLKQLLMKMVEVKKGLRKDGHLYGNAFPHRFVNMTDCADNGNAH